MVRPLVILRGDVTLSRMQITCDTCATSRSKVSNGTRLLQNVDGRSSSARRFRDLVRAYEIEAGGSLSEVERGLIRQAAALTFKAEALQSDLVNGTPVDGDQLIRLSDTVKDLLNLITAKGQHRAELCV
jgi:hypothetical protein